MSVFDLCILSNLTNINRFSGLLNPIIFTHPHITTPVCFLSYSFDPKQTDCFANTDSDSIINTRCTHLAIKSLVTFVWILSQLALLTIFFFFIFDCKQNSSEFFQKIIKINSLITKLLG